MNHKKLLHKLAASAVVCSMLGSAVPLSVSAETVTNISDAASLGNALVTGGKYKLTANINVANAGIEPPTVTDGELDGGGFTIKKANEYTAQALLFQNAESSWSIKNVTFDGNKSNVTFSDACMWYMSGDVVFDNVVFTDFKGSSDVRSTLTNAGAELTLRNVTFKNNENTSGKFGTNPGINTEWSGGTTILEGTTKANVYYTAGTLDVSGLTKGANVVITAADENAYNTISSLTCESEDIVKTTDSTQKKVSFKTKSDEQPSDIILSFNFDDDIDEVQELFRGGMSIAQGEGISGNAAQFDGNEGYMQLPNDIIASEMTFMAWVKTESAREWARLFDFGTEDISNNFFFAPGYGKVELKTDNTINNEIWLDPHSRTGVWELYAVTVSADKIKVYRDGECIAEQELTADITKLKQDTNYIGASHYGWDAKFHGKMDDIKLYNRVCTAEEIKTEYKSVAGNLKEKYAKSDCKNLKLNKTLAKGATLPTVGASESVITWKCSETGIINEDMSINTPAKGEPDKRVTFTATVTNGDASYTKQFEVVLLAEATLTGLKDYPISKVKMTDEYLNNADDKMAEYLMDIDLDRYVAGFREMAGIEHSEKPYGGWENSLIAGHTVGHYATAIAQAYEFSVASGEPDTDILERSQKLIDALYEAQIKEDGVVQGKNVKKGYLFAATDKNWYDSVPMYGEQQFDEVMDGSASIIEEAWVPWYTMHKILAGLIDNYKLTGNEKAFEAAKLLGDWTYNRINAYTDGEKAILLNIEYGGMNDCLYELYKLTGKAEYAKAAHMFDEVTLFEEMNKKNDVLPNKHANTTIPKFVGAINRYRAYLEMGDKLLTDSPDEHDIEFYLTAAENFWEMVVNDHSYITGGNSENEHFRDPHTENAYRNNVNCETCNTYNMLKLSRELYKITGDRKYAEYYENTFLNAIVSSQNPETGMTMYFQPMASGYFKVYSNPYDNFWCCTGTGMESMTKLNDSIYYKKDNTIIVNQYISSVLTDDANGVVLEQKSDTLNGGGSTFTVKTAPAKAENNGWSLTAEKSVSGTITTVSGSISGNLETDNAPSLYIAAYAKNGELKYVKKADYTVNNTNAPSYSENVSADSSCDIKVFLWNDLEPIVNAVTATESGESNITLALRIPEWAAQQPVIKVNGTQIAYTQSAGYAEIVGLKNNDTVEITLPMELEAYGLPDNSNVVAFKYGPIVLSADLGDIKIENNTQNTESHGMGVRKPNRIADINEYVVVNSDYGTRDEWLDSLNGNIEKTPDKLEFRLKNTDRNDLVFTPHYSKHDKYYGIYWYLVTPSEDDEETVLAAKQSGREENITIDSIEPGHDQQENGHGWSSSGNTTFAEGEGNTLNYRSIPNGGYVDYQMMVNKTVKNYIAVTYVAEDAGKKMNIYAADTLIASVTAGDKNETVKYEIPANVLENAYTAGAGAQTIEGKDALHIVFKADCGTDAPRLNGKVKIVTDYGTNASLSSLTVSSGELTPQFSPGITSYELNASGLTELTIKAVPADKYGLVYVNGKLINDAIAKTVSLGDEPVVIKVTAEDHKTEQTYTINVTK